MAFVFYFHLQLSLYIEGMAFVFYFHLQLSLYIEGVALSSTFTNNCLSILKVWQCLLLSLTTVTLY